MARDWSRQEVELTVADYFDMLCCELRETLKRPPGSGNTVIALRSFALAGLSAVLGMCG